jgi:hypothetical protein
MIKVVVLVHLSRTELVHAAWMEVVIFARLARTNLVCPVNKEINALVLLALALIKIVALLRLSMTRLDTYLNKVMILRLSLNKTSKNDHIVNEYDSHARTELHGVDVHYYAWNTVHCWHIVEWPAMMILEHEHLNLNWSKTC